VDTGISGEADAAIRPKKRPTAATKSINLALQGGGAHGAFTWGVLDRLLEEERIDIEGISATSAGSMNATVLAYGSRPQVVMARRPRSPPSGDPSARQP
jgi:predicted acylesterase/phospholipase RssA